VQHGDDAARPAPGARPLAVFDLDGTITRRDTFNPYVFGWLARQPLRWWRLLGALPTLLAFAVGRADRGALKGRLLHVTMGGQPRAVVEAWSDVFVERLLRTGVHAEALERIRWHRGAGHRLVLMSASVDCYVSLLGARLGFDDTVCSRARWLADGRLDGRLDGPNCRGARKLVVLRELLRAEAVVESWGYGNSRADIDHLLAVTHPVYVNGDPGPLPPGAPRFECVRWR
jgi:HAD superfamily hydrolase (TIGR01490 family)